MEDWVTRALEKWPNVPSLFGWLGLDRRGRWLIKGEVISRPQIIDTINPNYACDEQGRWYFQNGPQRGYITLEYTPLVLHTDDGGRLLTHTGVIIGDAKAAYLDEHGSLVLDTTYGAGVLDNQDLEWALARLRTLNQAVDESQIGEAMSLISGEKTSLQLHINDADVPIFRLDVADMPQQLGFIRTRSPDQATTATLGATIQTHTKRAGGEEYGRHQTSEPAGLDLPRRRNARIHDACGFADAVLATAGFFA